MNHPLGRLGWIQVAEHRTLHAAWSISEVGWQLYPVYAVDDGGVCTCPKGMACTDPGKHPTTPHGFNDASSDPERIAELFTRWPGDNVGHKIGRASGTVIIDVDPRKGGWKPCGDCRSSTGTSRAHQAARHGWRWISLRAGLSG